MLKCQEPGLIFMQDNAPIYTARTVRNWFLDIAIPLVYWPPFSPDLNPIEHIQHYLKNSVLEKYLELEGIGKGEEAIKALENALVNCWNELPDSLFEQIVCDIGQPQ